MVDEYNWIYNSRADGGSGICEDNPATTTCIAPLSGPEAFDDYIVPKQVTIALGFATANDPRPSYSHVSNLADDRLLLPMVTAILSTYRSTFAANTPVALPDPDRRDRGLHGPDGLAHDRQRVHRHRLRPGRHRHGADLDQHERADHGAERHEEGHRGVRRGLRG